MNANAVVSGLIIFWGVLVLCVMAFFQGCAAPIAQEHLTPLGIYFVDDTERIDPVDIDKVAVCVLEMYDVPIKRLQELSVRMVFDDYVGCWGDERAERLRPYGCYWCDNNSIQVAYFSGNGWAWTFKHELKHYVMDLQGKHCDGNHSAPIWDDVVVCDFEEN